MARFNAIVALVVLLGSVAGLAQSQRVLAGGDPSVQDRLADGIYTVEGHFDVDSSAATTWAVLTDYDHLGRFVSSISKSVVRQRRLDQLLLEQDGTGKALLFVEHFHVLLEVREFREGGISFRDVSHRDFDLYEGSWNVAPALHGLEVIYQLRAKPRQKVPGFIGEPAFDAGATRLLADVRAEILRRTKAELDNLSALPHPHGGSDAR